MATLLEGVGLGQFTEAFANLGAITHHDLQHHIGTSDLTQMGMTIVQVRKYHSVSDPVIL